MKTEKLVLGFCALASVAGAAPRLPVCSTLVLDVSPRSVLAKAVSSTEKRAEYAKLLKKRERALKADTARLLEMGEDEADCIESALMYERLVYFLDEIVIRDIKLADKKIARIRRDLTKAEERAKGAWVFVEWREANVEKLKFRLGKAEQQKEHILEQAAKSCEAANDFFDMSQKYRKKAGAVHAKRMKLITSLNKAYTRDRVRYLRRGLNLMELGCDISIPDLDVMAFWAIQDIAVLHEAHRRRDDVLCLDLRLRKCIKKGDYDLFREVIDKVVDDVVDGVVVDDRELYSELHASYLQICSYPRHDDLLEQINQVSILGDSYSLVEKVCSRLRGYTARFQLVPVQKNYKARFQLVPVQNNKAT
jgi:hypothetical protein